VVDGQESDVLGLDDMFEYTFDEAGTYEYSCGVHGDSMTGTITVE
jgi:plastocyanin